MKKAIIAIAILATCGAALLALNGTGNETLSAVENGEKEKVWMRYFEESKSHFYIKLAERRETGEGKFRVVVLRDYEAERKVDAAAHQEFRENMNTHSELIPHNESFKSNTFVKEVNCNDQSVRIIGVTLHSERMGNGDTVWMKINPKAEFTPSDENLGDKELYLTVCK